MQFRDRKSQQTPEWFDLKESARRRSAGRCEFCGLPLNGNGDLHHRTYPKGGTDGLHNLMLLHRECHMAIHQGGKIKIAKHSLAKKGDTGKCDTKLWREYLQSKKHL